MVKQIRTYSGDKALVSERRKYIVNGAAKLFLEHGYQRTSTRQLTETLGISKGALYNYIGSKEDILYLVIQFSAENQKKLIAKMRKQTKDLSSIDTLKESIKIYFSNVDELQDVYNFNNHAIVDLTRNDRHVLFDSESMMVEYFVQLLKAGVERSEFEISDPIIVAHDIVLAANAWANRRWYLLKHYTFGTYIEHVLNYTLKAIVKLTEE
jgi:AcrR family transcriptional regulator